MDKFSSTTYSDIRQRLKEYFNLFARFDQLCVRQNTLRCASQYIKTYVVADVADLEFVCLFLPSFFVSFFPIGKINQNTTSY